MTKMTLNTRVINQLIPLCNFRNLKKALLATWSLAQNGDQFPIEFYWHINGIYTTVPMSEFNPKNLAMLTICPTMQNKL